MPGNGIKDIAWYAPAGSEMTPEQWQDPNARCMGLLLNGEVEEARRNADEDVPEVLLMVMNSHHEPVQFKLPNVATGGAWRRVFDTDNPETELDGSEDETAYDAPARSLQVFAWIDPA